MNYLIPTIDVEALRSLSRLGDFDRLIMGKRNDEYFGVPKILDIIGEYNGSGTFYVDFAEVGHGTDKLKELSDLIIKKGSDIQLHIHPQFIADKNRYLLNQYSKKEQAEIIEKCIEIYKQCTGGKPTSFRAGGYGADESTIELLREHGFNSDSSYFYNHKWCNIKPKPLNKISRINNIYEIPVTIFENKISYTFAGQTVKEKTLIKKLDIDGCTKEELQKGFDALKSSGVRVIILFLHSFSLFKIDYNYKNIYPDFTDAEKLKFILDYSLKNNYQIASVKTVTPLLDNYINDNEIIPTITTERNFIKSSVITVKKKIKKKLRGK